MGAADCVRYLRQQQWGGISESIRDCSALYEYEKYIYNYIREIESLHFIINNNLIFRPQSPRAQEPRPTPNISGLYLARASRAKLVGIGSRRPLCERWRRLSSGLLMALGKILLGRWTADIYLEDCLMIRSTGVDNEDCA